MTTQRIKNMDVIRQPYQRTSTQIKQLEAKHQILHTRIINFRDRIQSSRNDRNCKGCKIYQDEIAVIKNQQKEKTVQLQVKIRRLEESNKSMTNNIMHNNNMTQNNYKISSLLHSSVMANPILIGNNSFQAQQMHPIINQVNLLDIDQARNQHGLNKQRKDRSGNYKSELYNNKGGSSANLNQALLLQASQIKQKCKQLEELNIKLKEELQQDRLSKINLINSIDIYKQQLQNADKLHQVHLREIEQQNEKMSYQLTIRQKNYQNQINSLKSQIQSSNRNRQSIALLKQERQKEILSLKKDKNEYELAMGKLRSQLEYIIHDNGSKQDQIANIGSKLLLFDQNNFLLHKQLQQCKQLNEQSKHNCNTLSIEIAALKQSKKLLELNLANTSSQQNRQHKEYLDNMIKQNHLVNMSHQNHIKQLQKQIQYLKIQNNKLAEKLHQNTSALSEEQKMNNQKSEKIKYFQRQINQINLILESTQRQKDELQHNLNQLNNQRLNFSLKYNEDRDKHTQLQKKNNNIERQFKEYKRSAIQTISNNKKIIDQLSHELVLLKIELQKQAGQSKNIKMAYENEQVGLVRWKQELQLSVTLREARQTEIQAKNKQIEQITFFNNQMYQDIEYFRGQNHFLVNKLSGLQHILVHTQENYNKSITQIKQYQQQQLTLQQNITYLQAQNNLINKQHKSSKQILQEKINSQQDQIFMRKQNIKELDRIILKEKQTVNALTKINIELQNKNQKDFQENLHLKEYTKQLQNEIKVLKQENKISKQYKAMGVRVENNEDIRKNGDQSQKMIFRIIELEGKLSQIEQAHDKLSASYDRLMKKNQALLDQQRINMDNIFYLNQKIQSLNKIYQIPDGQSTEELKKELKQKKQMVAQLLANFKYMEKALKNKEAEYNQLYEKHQKTIKTTDRQRFQATERLTSKQASLNAAKRQKDEDSKQYLAKKRQLQKRLAYLQQQLKKQQRKHIQDKKKIEQQLARVIDEKKKVQKASSKSITSRKDILDPQKKRSHKVSLNTSPAKQQQPKKRQQYDPNIKQMQQNKKRINQLQIELKQKDDRLLLLEIQNKYKDQQIEQMNDLLNIRQVQLDINSQQLKKYEAEITIYQKQIERLNSQTKSEKIEGNQEQILIEGIQIAQSIQQINQ